MMIHLNAVLTINGDKVVPVRAIPFVTGGDMGPRCIASILADPEHNLLAQVLGPNNSVTPMLPKHWRQYVAQLSANGSSAPDSYTRTELEILPASTFVYWEGLWRTHEVNYLPPREQIAGLSEIEQSNCELEPIVRIPEALETLVFEGFPSIVIGSVGAGPIAQPALDVATGKTARSTETAPQRQDRRLKQCEDAGLTMDKTALRRLPDGVGAEAEKECVSRQTFSADLRAALKRKLENERSGE